MEELFHLYLGLVELLKYRFDVADGAIVWSLIVGNSGVPVARQRAWLKLSFKAGKRARTTRLWFCVLLRSKPKHKGLREGVCSTHRCYSLKSCGSWARHQVWTRGSSFLVPWHCDLTCLWGVRGAERGENGTSISIALLRSLAGNPGQSCTVTCSSLCSHCPGAPSSELLFSHHII